MIMTKEEFQRLESWNKKNFSDIQIATIFNFPINTHKITVSEIVQILSLNIDYDNYMEIRYFEVNEYSYHNIIAKFNEITHGYSMRNINHNIAIFELLKKYNVTRKYTPPLCFTSFNSIWSFVFNSEINYNNWDW